jgi:hypothetical protein
LTYQASSRHFLFIAEHDKCGRTIIAGTGQSMMIPQIKTDMGRKIGEN